MIIGSDEHKELFCRSFVDSHLAYEPADLPWPDLDEQSLAFLHAVPVWRSALEVEVNAGAMLDAFAATQNDGLVREALQLQGYEEARHGRMLRALFDRYGIEVPALRPSITSSKAAFVSFGYDECLDSFFGFGIFRIAREANVVAESLINLFARILIEEARHIVFFVNWVAYDRARRGVGAPILQALPTAWGYAQALFKTIRRGRSANADERGMEAFDPRLLRPRVVPMLVRCALRILPRRARTSAIVGQTASS
jgi:hypothetical protein